MAITLNKFRYRNYIKRSQQAHTRLQKQDLLYTFLDYYRHIGSTITHTKSGDQYIQVINSFQRVIRDYHLEKPISTLKDHTITKAVNASVPIMELWYYTIHNKTINKTINVKDCRTEKQAIQRIELAEDKLHRERYVCLGMKFYKTKVILTLIIPYSNER